MINNPDTYSDITTVPAELSADVVFVVQSCIYSDSTLVNRVAASLASELDSRNFSHNNFALVTFNDIGVHIHTFNGGELWTQDESQLAPDFR